MRYYTADDLTYTTDTGRVVRIKATLPIVPRAAQSNAVKIDADVALDEVASRPDIYGDGREASAYQVFDENVIELFDARLRMELLGSLRIPG
jgi:hypothetical protein